MGVLPQHIIMLETALHMDGKAFTRILINDSQHAERTTVVSAVGYKIIRPDMTLMLRSTSDAGAVIKPKSTALRLFLWNFKPFTSPDTFNPFEVDRPAFSPKQSRYPAVAIATIF